MNQGIFEVSNYEVWFNESVADLEKILKQDKNKVVFFKKKFNRTNDLNIKDILQKNFIQCRALYKQLKTNENKEKERSLVYLVGNLYNFFLKHLETELYINAFLQSIHFSNTISLEVGRLIEKAWNLFCDLRDLLPYIRSIIGLDTLIQVYKIIHDLENFFRYYFGLGVYFSTVLEVNRFLCNICEEVVEDCLHIIGNIYNGQRCCAIADEIIDIKGIDIVKVPSDYRCRLWSWNKNQDGTFKAMVMCLSNFDDWITSDI